MILLYQCNNEKIDVKIDLTYISDVSNVSVDVLMVNCLPLCQNCLALNVATVQWVLFKRVYMHYVQDFVGPHIRDPAIYLMVFG